VTEPVEEPEGAHRAVARAFFGAALRVLPIGLALEVAMLGTVLLAHRLGWYDWETWDDPWIPNRWYFESHCLPGLITIAIFAFGLGSLRLAEGMSPRIRPDATYGRKLLMGVIGAVVAALVTCGVLFQFYYVKGIFETGTFEGAFARIARADWFSRGGSYEDRMRDPSLYMIVDLVAPFALTAFARARGLSLPGQVLFAGAFLVLLYARTFAFWTAYGGARNTGPWIVLWLACLAVPLLARLGDRLEARLTPRWLRPPMPPASRAEEAAPERGSAL
jgi:hypothetical protein